MCWRLFNVSSNDSAGLRETCRTMKRTRKASYTSRFQIWPAEVFTVYLSHTHNAAGGSLQHVGTSVGSYHDTLSRLHPETFELFLVSFKFLRLATILMYQVVTEPPEGSDDFLLHEYYIVNDRQKIVKPRRKRIVRHIDWDFVPIWLALLSGCERISIICPVDYVWAAVT